MRPYLAGDPLPYRPIKIVDVSPFRSSIRRKPDKAGTKQPAWVRITSAVLLGSAIAVVAAVASVGAAPGDVAGEFRLGPGHVMPVAIAADGADVADTAAGFRLAPGHAMPADLAR